MTPVTARPPQRLRLRRRRDAQRRDSSPGPAAGNHPVPANPRYPRRPNCASATPASVTAAPPSLIQV
jgi:hypothetical protein